MGLTWQLPVSRNPISGRLVARGTCQFRSERDRPMKYLLRRELSTGGHASDCQLEIGLQQRDRRSRHGDQELRIVLQ